MQCEQVRQACAASPPYNVVALAGTFILLLLKGESRGKQNANRKGLTAILRLGYPRHYDYEIFCPHLCNRSRRRLYCASPIANSGRITNKTSRT
jgi:hypothetical protein